MLDFFKKTVLTGVGMALRSRNEIEELASELAKTSRMSQSEARQFLDDCLKKYEDARSSLDQRIENTLNSLMKKLDIPTRSDIQTLREKVDELARKLEDRT